MRVCVCVGGGGGGGIFRLFEKWNLALSPLPPPRLPASSYHWVKKLKRKRLLPARSVQSPLGRGGGSKEEFVPQLGIGEKPLPKTGRTTNHLAHAIHVLDKVNLQGR